MTKLTARQKRIVTLMRQLPDEMEQEEFEALICSLVSWYVGEEGVPAFLMYMSVKVSNIFQRMVEQAEKETKH
jgi:hypothetical protein